MWLDLLAAASESDPVTPPSVPFETIGIVLVAMVTGLTGIIVALIQRGKPKADVPAPTPPGPGPNPTTHPVFIVSKEDWDKFRDMVVSDHATLERHVQDYEYHERWTTGEVRELDNEISRIKGHLGIQ